MHLKLARQLARDVKPTRTRGLFVSFLQRKHVNARQPCSI
jgi:hypothetical protein